MVTRSSTLQPIDTHPCHAMPSLSPLVCYLHPVRTNNPCVHYYDYQWATTLAPIVYIITPISVSIPIVIRTIYLCNLACLPSTQSGVNLSRVSFAPSIRIMHTNAQSHPIQSYDHRSILLHFVFLRCTLPSVSIWTPLGRHLYRTEVPSLAIHCKNIGNAHLFISVGRNIAIRRKLACSLAKVH